MSETQINFPSDPAGQTPENTFSPVSVPDASKNGVTYIYENGVWSAVAGESSGGGGGDGNASIITSDTPPTAPPPEDGDLWWNTSSNTLYIYYVDEDTSQWVVTTPQNNIANDLNFQDVTDRGNNTTNTITIGPEEGPPVTTLANDGSATFEGTVTAESFVVSGGDGGGSGGEGDLLVTGDLTVLGASTLSGLITGNGGILLSTSTASSDSNFIVFNETGSGGAYGYRISHSGNSELSFDRYSGGWANTLKLMSDGSAAFTGRTTVEAGPLGSAFKVVNTNGTNSACMGIQVRTSTTGADVLEMGYDTGSGDNITTTIGALGEANFSAGLNNLNAVTIGPVSSNVGSQPLVNMQVNGSSDAPAFKVQDVVGSKGDVATIYGSGSAEFAGDVDLTGDDSTLRCSFITLDSPNAYLEPNHNVILIQREGGNWGPPGAKFGGIVARTGDGSAASIDFIRGSANYGNSGDIVFNTHAGSAGDPTEMARFKYDGSAVFKGDINSGARNSTASDTEGALLFPSGGFIAQCKSDASDLTSFFMLHRGKITGGGPGEGVKVQMFADGSAEFAGGIASGNGIKLNKTQILVRGDSETETTSAFTVYRGGQGANNITARIAQNGSAEFKGNVTTHKINTFDGSASWGIELVGADETTDSRGKLNVQGRNTVNSTLRAIEVYKGNTSIWHVDYAGNAGFRNAIFNLEPDNASNYTTTTDYDGNETTEYTGPTLDVKDHLQKTRTALETLKSAAAASSDFATLKAAIATALADI